MSAHGWIAPEDEKTMIDFYMQRSRKVGNLTGERLVGNMEWRIYTEWCCNPKESNWEDQWKYRGEAFEKWIKDEIHYALERGGFMWNPEQQGFDENGNFAQIYVQNKEKVLHASVRRAVDFFQNCKDYCWPREGNTRNLRVSLKPYIYG